MCKNCTFRWIWWTKNKKKIKLIFDVSNYVVSLCWCFFSFLENKYWTNWIIYSNHPQTEMERHLLKERKKIDWWVYWIWKWVYFEFGLMIRFCIAKRIQTWELNYQCWTDKTEGDQRNRFSDTNMRGMISTKNNFVSHNKLFREVQVIRHSRRKIRADIWYRNVLLILA